MAYADRSATGSRTVAFVIVLVVVAAVGYAFVTGLAVDIIKHAATQMKIVDIQEPPPPPPDVPPPPPPPENHAPPPPPKMVTPPAIVKTVTLAPPIQSVQYAPPRPPTPVTPPTPPEPPQVPTPPAKVISQAAGLKGNPGQYFGTDAYPPGAIRAEAQGRVVAQLSVGPDGRVSGCTVTSSSNNSDLDDATCRIAKRSVRFTPAKDASGSPISSSFTLPVKWVLPKD